MYRVTTLRPAPARAPMHGPTDEDCIWDCGGDACHLDEDGYHTCDYEPQGSAPLSFWSAMIMELAVH